MKRVVLIIAINLILVCAWLVHYYDSKNLEAQDIQLVVDENITQAEIDEVTAAFNSVPNFVIKRFVEDDWKVVILSHETVVEENLEPFNNNKTAGTINFTKKTITLRSYSPKEGAVRNVMLHEICHFIDRLSGDLSSTEEFQELYEEFKDGGYITFNYDGISIDDVTREDIMYATSSEKEFYSESLKDFFTHKEWLIENYPDIYIYHNTYIKETVFGQR